MIEHVKDIHYYMELFKKRKKLIIIPALIIIITSTTIALSLRPVFESTCTILIEEQQIPPDFVRSTVTGFADQRIQSLTQQILSRSKLIDIIDQLNLYPEMTARYTKDEIAKKMRKSIRIDMISAMFGDRSRRSPSGQGDISIAFTISYQGHDPGTLQKVTGTLASLYLEQNIKQRESQAQSTTKFLEFELKNLEKRIQSLGDQIAKFKEEHAGMLPELQQFNMAQAERLESEIKQLDINIRAAEERRMYLEGQIATVQQEGTGAADPVSRLRAIQVNLADLRAKFSEDHPDVRKLLREKAELEKMVGRKGKSDSLRQQKLADLKMELANKQGKYSGEHPDIIKIKKEIKRLEAEIAAKKPDNTVETDSGSQAYLNLSTQIKVSGTEIESLKKQRIYTVEKLKECRRRLEETPKIEQEYLALRRDYNNAQQKHQEVMNKILEARIAEGMEEHQKGEKFKIIEPANYPATPIKPNRPVIIMSGVFFGLMVGFGVVILMDNLDHSVKSADELAWLTGVQVLGTIKRIRIPEDEQKESYRRRIIYGAVGLSLITGLLIFHFFYMDLNILVAKIINFAKKRI